MGSKELSKSYAYTCFALDHHKSTEERPPLLCCEIYADITHPAAHHRNRVHDAVASLIFRA
jgi:hypothetical protein